MACALDCGSGQYIAQLQFCCHPGCFCILLPVRRNICPKLPTSSQLSVTAACLIKIKLVFGADQVKTFCPLRAGLHRPAHKTRVRRNFLIGYSTKSSFCFISQSGTDASLRLLVWLYDYITLYEGKAQSQNNCPLQFFFCPMVALLTLLVCPVIGVPRLFFRSMP